MNAKTPSFVNTSVLCLCSRWVFWKWKKQSFDVQKCLAEFVLSGFELPVVPPAFSSREKCETVVQSHEMNENVNEMSSWCVCALLCTWPACLWLSQKKITQHNSYMIHVLLYNCDSDLDNQGGPVNKMRRSSLYFKVWPTVNNSSFNNTISRKSVNTVTLFSLKTRGLKQCICQVCVPTFAPKTHKTNKTTIWGVRMHLWIIWKCQMRIEI